jgi:uncharacterized membrane protein
MDKRRSVSERAWLRDELPRLLGEGILDARAVERLRVHYRLDELAPSESRAVLAFAVMGGGLVGAGTILLVAHNWDAMSRPSRAALCFSLLLVAQALSAFALVRGRASDALREGSALFLTASFGAAFSLVSQTYHAQGELGDFLLGWVAPMIPVVYLLEARVSAVVLSALALGLAFGRDHAIDRGYVFVAVIAALAPFVVQTSRRHAGARRSAWLEIALAGAAVIGLGALISRDAPAALGLGLLVLFVAARLGGRAAENGLLGALAALGLGVASIALTFDDVIESLYDGLRGWGRGDLALTVALALATFALVAWVARRPVEARRDELPVAAALAPAWMTFGLGFAHASPSIGALLFDVYVFAFGLERLLVGLGGGDRRRSNLGLLLLSGLFLARFFDSDLTFLQRGFGMMAVGAAFLALNLYLGRRAAQVAR